MPLTETPGVRPIQGVGVNTPPGCRCTGQHAFSTKLETRRLLTAPILKILQTEMGRNHLSKKKKKNLTEF